MSNHTPTDWATLKYSYEMARNNFVYGAIKIGALQCECIISVICVP